MESPNTCYLQLWLAIATATCATTDALPVCGGERLVLSPGVTPCTCPQQLVFTACEF
jgi:hypothetical protein